MGLFDEPQPAYFLPRRAIAAFTGYCVIEEVGSDELEITQHPVQTGAAITDHAYRKPSTVTVRALYGPQRGPLNDTYAAMLALQESREPFDVVTGKRVYRSMLLKTLGVTEDGPTKNVVAFTAELQEVILVNVETVTVPPRAKHATPAKTAATEQGGKKAANEATEKHRSAILKTVDAFRKLARGEG
jgi:hypothetical protein